MEREVSEAVYDYLLSFVPYGQLTNFMAIREYIIKVFGDDVVTCHGITRPHSSEERELLCKSIPRYREVSESGMLLHIGQAEKLIEEGHTIVPYSKSNDALKVKNVKKVWFDFEKEIL